MSKKMSPSEHWQHELNKNLRRPCAVSGCPDKRDRIGKYCKYHDRKQRTFGSPLGRKVKRYEYKAESKVCADFVAENQEHPAIKLAQEYLKQWIEHGATHPSATAFNKTLKRLHDHYVTPQDILSECAALWLFDQYRKLFKSKEEMVMGLGGLVYWLAPVPFRHYTASTGTKVWRYQRLPTKTKRQLGNDLHSMLCPVLINISRAIIKREEEKAQEKRDLHLPFN